MKKNPTKIKVKNSGLVRLPLFDDFRDGKLTAGEVGRHIPFKIKRFYVISDLSNGKAVRGRHAHKNTEQYIFCLNGKFTLNLNDGKTKQNITLNEVNMGVFLGKMLWHSMSNFSKDCLILVVASDHYNEKDYIRNYGQFLKIIKSK